MLLSHYIIIIMNRSFLDVKSGVMNPEMRSILQKIQNEVENNFINILAMREKKERSSIIFIFKRAAQL